MRVRKVNIFKDIELEIFNSIETFFDSQKFDILFLPIMWPDSLKIVFSGRIRHFKKIILKGKGFRGGSDEKMRRMWFGLEIDVVGLPPLNMHFIIYVDNFLCLRNLKTEFFLTLEGFLYKS